MQMTRRAASGLAYEEMGSGPAILFIAGLAGLGAYWDRQMAALASTHRVVTFDHRGLGASMKAPPPYDIEMFANDALGLLDELGIGRAVLVGHSTGGTIAQMLAARHPARVAGLLLGATWARPDARFTEVFTLRAEILRALGPAAYQRLGHVLTAPLVWGAAEAASARAITDNAAGLDASADRAREMAVTAGRIAALLAYDAATSLAALRCPTLVMAAADDGLVTTNLSRDLAREIAGARWVLLARGGHHFPRTRAGAYNRYLRAFLASL